MNRYKLFLPLIKRNLLQIVKKLLHCRFRLFLCRHWKLFVDVFHLHVLLRNWLLLDLLLLLEDRPWRPRLWMALHWRSNSLALGIQHNQFALSLWVPFLEGPDLLPDQDRLLFRLAYKQKIWISKFKITHLLIWSWTRSIFGASEAPP